MGVLCSLPLLGGAVVHACRSGSSQDSSDGQQRTPKIVVDASERDLPTAPMRAGMYESFYLRTVSPDEPVGVWIRNTVHKRPGRPPQGSVWCTLFDARGGGRSCTRRRPTS